MKKLCTISLIVSIVSFPAPTFLCLCTFKYKRHLIESRIRILAESYQDPGGIRKTVLTVHNYLALLYTGVFIFQAFVLAGATVLPLQ
jgi:hypothetical protein